MSTPVPPKTVSHDDQPAPFVVHRPLHPHRHRERHIVVGGLPRICLIGRDVLRLCSLKFGSNGEASLVFPHKDFGAFGCT
ncbi:hypothetical protein WMF30_20890 [Sorangium sp. So ce134]